jgi:hypothetical protein
LIELLQLILRTNAGLLYPDESKFTLANTGLFI